MHNSTTDATTAAPASGVRCRAGKYLTFKLGNEEYGLEILKVREIIGVMTITPVPRAPSCVRGVINLRGKIIPVIDARRKFEMPDREDTEETCIIVVDVSSHGASVDMGILVDTVSEVLNISAAEIEKTPDLNGSEAVEFILAMAKTADSVKMLLDIDRVLAADAVPNELETVAASA